MTVKSRLRKFKVKLNLKSGASYRAETIMDEVNFLKLMGHITHAWGIGQGQGGHVCIGGEYFKIDEIENFSYKSTWVWRWWNS